MVLRESRAFLFERSPQLFIGQGISLILPFNIVILRTFPEFTSQTVHQTENPGFLVEFLRLQPNHELSFEGSPITWVSGELRLPHH